MLLNAELSISIQVCRIEIGLVFLVKVRYLGISPAVLNFLDQRAG